MTARIALVDIDVDADTFAVGDDKLALNRRALSKLAKAIGFDLKDTNGSRREFRMRFGLKGTYTEAELRKPFAIPTEDA